MATAPVTVNIRQQSPGAVMNKVAQIAALSKGLDSAQALNMIGAAIQNLQQQIYAIDLSLKSIATALNNNASVVVSGGTVSIQEVTAVNSTTTTIPASVTPAVGAELAVFVTWDSTGGGLIAWNSLFRFPITNVDTTANTVSVFFFVGRTDPADATVRWFMVGLPLTGQV